MRVHVLPPIKLDGPAALATQLRQLADEIEAAGTARTVLVITDDGESVDFSCHGLRPRRSETIGLLCYAQHMVYERRG